MALDFLAISVFVRPEAVKTVLALLGFCVEIGTFGRDIDAFLIFLILVSVAHDGNEDAAAIGLKFKISDAARTGTVTGMEAVAQIGDILANIIAIFPLVSPADDRFGYTFSELDLFITFLAAGAISSEVVEGFAFVRYRDALSELTVVV